MLHVGLDLSRTRLDVHAMDQTGTPVAVTTAAPDAGGLASLAGRLGQFGQPVTAVIESMNGARFVHDQLELRGWTVEIADAVKVKGFAPLACKTDKIDAGCARRAGAGPLAAAPSSALLGGVRRGGWPGADRPSAGAARAGPDVEQNLELAEYGVERQAGAGTFGSRRNCVQKACARAASVTWRCQPR